MSEVKDKSKFVVQCRGERRDVGMYSLWCYMQPWGSKK